jgi:hypothetical protein
MRATASSTDTADLGVAETWIFHPCDLDKCPGGVT